VSFDTHAHRVLASDDRLLHSVAGSIGPLIQFVARCAGLVAALACGSTTNGGEPATITLRGPNGDNAITMLINATVPLTVTARDESGSAVAVTGPYDFLSRNGSIVSVDSAGTVTARNQGSAYVVAKLSVDGRTLSDSVKCTVAIPISP
jgi:Bacterial Ig-like domain (group 2).